MKYNNEIFIIRLSLLKFNAQYIPNKNIGILCNIAKCVQCKSQLIVINHITGTIRISIYSLKIFINLKKIGNKTYNNCVYKPIYPFMFKEILHTTKFIYNLIP